VSAEIAIGKDMVRRYLNELEKDGRAVRIRLAGRGAPEGWVKRIADAAGGNA
jgi:hypothetical protein